MTSPARILIVDDETPARRRLSDLLDDCRDAFPLAIADEAANGLEAIEIINGGGIDIVLCDIRMPVMDGLEVARHLAKLDQPPRLIFTTAYDAYAVEAFELNAIDYLLKPIRQERLLAALQKAAVVKTGQAEAVASATQSRRKHLSIHERGKILLVPVEDVIYLKAELKYVTVKTAAKEYLLEESLTKLEEEFEGIFTRIHRNTLIARKSVAGFEKASEGDDENGGHWVAVLHGLDEKLPVSRRQAHVIKEF
ncbi:MAG: response regulator transcription factor [Betaproteobacteria bacterium]|nr:response regulator transcription factor [Betaproteobacteria bacterium]